MNVNTLEISSTKFDRQSKIILNVAAKYIVIYLICKLLYKISLKSFSVEVASQVLENLILQLLSDSQKTTCQMGEVCYVMSATFSMVLITGKYKTIFELTEIL